MLTNNDMIMTMDDQSIILRQMRRFGMYGDMHSQEQQCTDPAWKDAQLMARLTRMRHDFEVSRLALASGLSETFIRKQMMVRA